MKESNDAPNNGETSKDPSRELFSSSFAKQNAHQVPEIKLPKGGGALKGIDEKFEVNPVNGSNSVSIPLPVSPARAGFSPNLTLQYSSGQGNGLFGMGWGIGLPSIRRKTDKQLPKYQDGAESDTFIFAGAEDLIPKLVQSPIAPFEWQPQEETTTTHIIKQYRPRIEGSWLRIERWKELTTGIIHWRTISTSNVITVYGDRLNSRIENPATAVGTEVFEWLISYSCDNLGNLIQYEYKEEDLVGVSTSSYEKNRNKNTLTNRYLKRIHYGNKKHYVYGSPLPLLASDFLFETVLDYGEHNYSKPSPKEAPNLNWSAREDAFSSFRSGFDIRTYRLCQRVLLFHKFKSHQAINEQLVRSLELTYSDEPDESSNHNLEGFKYLRQARHLGYNYDAANKVYKSKDQPPLSFFYQAHTWNTTIKTLEEGALTNAPTGINNSGYQWKDLYGEGLSGILIENAQAWFYKQNLGGGTFGTAQLLQEKPSLAGLQWQDLEGTGEKQLVNWGAAPKGYFNYKDGKKWEGLQLFEQVPNHNLSNDPNARFVDLDGDGKPDLLITEEDIFRWYPSTGKKGFGKAQTISLPLDEDEGPRIVFADASQSIYLADMTGDGMTDIVRIKEGSVCYWANKGYGHFSSKITMSEAPQFTYKDSFNPQYLQLADIDGSGTTDLIYLHKNSIQIWMNHNGNNFAAAPKIIHPFPSIDQQVNVDIIDLLGNGTACLVWSSPHAKNKQQPLRYIDLTNGLKPHLLYEYKNNTGAAVQFEYKSSVHYYLADKKAGTPWATKLPFPVHVVSKTTHIDYIQNTIFTNLYSYHHGYYDQKEREFRGFGRVEQLDSEDLNTLNQTGASNILAHHFQVPIKTISWYHTGASFKHQQLTESYQTEYYSNPSIEQVFKGIELPPNLTNEAYHEAFRACKGLLLRQEVYSLDTDNPKHEHPYQCTESCYKIQVIQPHEGQKYASFISVPIQSMSYGYERNPQDPRIQQNLVLETDSYGIPTQTASIIYPRINRPIAPWMVQNEQAKTHATYTKISLTEDVWEANSYRLRTGYEEQIYEILGLNWVYLDAYYTPNTFKALLDDPNTNEIGFEQDHTGTGIQKRLSGHGKIKFLSNDLTTVLNFGFQDSLGFPYQSYQLVSTPKLRDQLYDAGAGNLLASANLDQASSSFYKEFNTDGNWWLPSGTSVFIPNPSENFYLFSEIKDVAGISTYIEYDPYQLFPISVRDFFDNTTRVEYDYRVLQPKLIEDPNQNQSVVAFDALGIIVKSAILGKTIAGIPEGDSLLNPTAVMEYNFFNWKDNQAPNYIYSRVREVHHSQNPDPNPVSQEMFEYSDGSGNVIMTKMLTKGGEAKLWDNGQVNTVNTTIHPQHTRRWIGNGRTILNNKGLPIKQYEPYFSVNAGFEKAPELVEIGYSPTLYYDAAGRNIKTVMPNGTFTKVVFDAWKTTEYDVNDTVEDSDWYTDIMNIPLPLSPLNAAKRRAANLTKDKHSNTPTITHLDCLGRTIYAENDDGDLATKNIAIFTQTDLAGRFSIVYDQLATEELLAQPNNYTTNRGWSSYERSDLLGQAVYSKTAVKGESYQFADALGRMVRIWDNPNHIDRRIFRTEYDPLHRPLATFVKRGNQAEICFAQTEYGETAPYAYLSNLRGQAYISRDQSGVMISKKFDFKGNPLLISRQLTIGYRRAINWMYPVTLESDVFETSTSYDALNRPTRTTLPDGTLLRSTYNMGGYLEHLEAQIKGQGNFKTFLKEQNYDAKGQKEWVKYGNGTITAYFYEAKTFRLRNLVTSNSTPNKLQDLHYTYDPAGNIMEVEDSAQSAYYYNNTLTTPKKQYTYDHLYRLIEATGREHAGNAGNNPAVPNHNDFSPVQNLPSTNIQSAVSKYTQTYDYDSVGNIKLMKHQYGASGAGGWKREYDYHQDARNQLKSTTISGTTSLPFNDYDVHGNMTKMPHLQALNWNFADQLTAVQLQPNSNGSFAYYNYDGSGQRVRKVITRGNKKRKERLYLGGLERYQEYDLNGNVKKERWTLQIDDIAQVDTLTIDNSITISNPQPLIRYQYSDHLGSASLETNELGAVISYEEYHPFGTTSYQTSSSSADISLKRYRFSNKERDDETGLYYFGVRYYAAWLGRWTSSDPGGFVDGLNLYHYVHNNPVNGVDELGYAAVDPSIDNLVNRDQTDVAKYEYTVDRGKFDNMETALFFIDGELNKEEPPSTHIDETGKVIAIYDDGDLSIYQYDFSESNFSDGQKNSYIASMREKTETTGGNGKKIGISLTPYSFADFGYLEDGTVTPGKGAFIDVDSDWAKKRITWLIDDWVHNETSSTYVYAKKAKRGEPYDLKYETEQKYGTSSYGSILFNSKYVKNKVYASSRDAGNFAAGLVQEKSWVPSGLITRAYGGYNQTGDFTTGIWLGFWNYVNFTGLGNSLQAPYYGEDIGTAEAINMGAKYEKTIGWNASKIPKKGGRNSGMGGFAGGSPSYKIPKKK